MHTIVPIRGLRAHRCSTLNLDSPNCGFNGTEYPEEHAQHEHKPQCRFRYAEVARRHPCGLQQFGKSAMIIASIRRTILSRCPRVGSHPTPNALPWSERWRVPGKVLEFMIPCSPSSEEVSSSTKRYGSSRFFRDNRPAANNLNRHWSANSDSSDLTVAVVPQF